MPIAYAFDDRIVAITMTGQYSTDELKRVVLEALADPRLPGGAVLLFDQRESDALRDRSPAEVRDMALFLARHADRFNSRIAMVVSQDVGFGMMRIGEVVAENAGLTPRVFREMPAAREWLLAEEQDPGA